MKTALALIAALLAAATLHAAEPLPAGSRLKAPTNATLRVVQVLPDAGVLAIVEAKNVRGEAYWSSGQIFIACPTAGVIDGQTLKPVPPIVATAEIYSYETVGAGTKTVQKFAFSR
jgi:hypothetical protein